MAGELSIEHLKPCGERFLNDLKGLLKRAVDDSERAMLIKTFTEARKDDLAFVEKRKNHQYIPDYFNRVDDYEWGEVVPRKRNEYEWGEGSKECCSTIRGGGPKPKDRIQQLNRIERAQEARGFTSLYKFAKGRKTCVAPNGGLFVAGETDKCFLSPWVAVHGIKSICFVTSQHMDMTRLPAFYQRDCMKQQNLTSFAEAVISDVECIPYVDYDYNDDKLRLCCEGHVMKPFGVVSCPEGDPHYDGSDRAIETIQNCFPMIENRPEDHFATIQAAIKAYQAMYQRELQAEDIWVSLMHVKYGCHEDLTMDIIREQLAIINGYSKEAPQKPLFFSCFSGMTPQKPAQKIGTSGSVRDWDSRGGSGMQNSDYGEAGSGERGLGRGRRQVCGRFRGRGGGAFDVGTHVWGSARSAGDGGSSGWVGGGKDSGMGVGWGGKYGGGSGRRGGGSSSRGSRGCGNGSWGGAGKSGGSRWVQGSGDKGGTAEGGGKWGKKAVGDEVGCGGGGGNGSGSDPSGGGSLKRATRMDGGW